jgi:SAM-dependent methyltransferase
MNSAPNATRRRSVLEALYPERRFSHIYREDGRLLFYTIVADLLKPTDLVLDFGAGRGLQVGAAEGYLKGLIDFKGRCSRIIGVDPDEVVLQNPYLDEAHVLGADGRIPIPNESVDLVVAYAVLEHIPEPASAVAELLRVLKPGGWFCAWTPNKWGYVGVAARAVPNRLHARIAKAAVRGDGRDARDVFPTVYRLNTVRDVRKHFSAPQWDNFSFTANGSPSYHFGSVFLARVWKLVMALSPPPFRKTLYVFARKDADAGSYSDSAVTGS